MDRENKKKSFKKMSFRPKVLVACREEEYGEELIDEIHMQGLVMEKCSKNNVHYSNAFMSDTTAEKSARPEEKYHKIQNDVFFRAFSVICRKAKFCSAEQCTINDAVAAEYVMEQEIKQQPHYKGLEQITPITDKEGKRQGIHYICPLTRLDEMAFPVKLYEEEMGVLIVGQFFTPVSEYVCREHIEKKLLEEAEITDKEEEDKKEISKEIEQKLNRIEQVKDLGCLTDQVVATVIDIEKGLIDYYKERQQQYVFEKSSELIETFRAEVAGIKPFSESLQIVYPVTAYVEYYEAVGNCIKNQLEALCHMVGAAKKEIFIPMFDNLTHNIYDTIPNENKNLKFWFGQWGDDNKEKRSFYEGNLKKYIPEIGDNFDLLLVSDSPSYPMALAVCCKEFLQGTGEEEKTLLKWTLCETFNKFTEYSQMKGMEAKSEYYRVFLDSYMAIQRHELGQSNAGYQMLIEDFKKQRNRLKKETHELRTDTEINDFLKRCDNFINDSETYQNTTMIQIQSSKYLIDFSDMEKEFFYPYETFLFKWNQIYGEVAEDAHLTYRFPLELTKYDQTRPRMYGNPIKIEQVAYNLTNNAMKYALPGTEVSLDCRLSKDRSRYEITVENWGSPFLEENEKEKIFDYGTRGSNNRKEGSGIGLFLTKEIAKAHNGGIYCDMKKHSEYNWPLVELYMEFYESRSVKHLCKDNRIYEELRREWGEKKTEIKQCITKKIEYNAFSPMYVNQNILRGTAKFTFTFWIPYVKD